MLMKFTIVISTALVVLAGSLAMAKDSLDQKRGKTRGMADQTLNDLYKLQPTAKAAIAKSAEHAVFTNMRTNLLVVSAAPGQESRLPLTASRKPS
jgi:hypothetical protein